MKLKRFLWAAALWTVLIIWQITLYSVRKDEMGKLGYFPIFILLWLFVSVISLVILILRALKVYRQTQSFFYVFLGQANLVVAALGFYQVFAPNANAGAYLEIILLAFNVVIALFIFRDYLSNER